MARPLKKGLNYFPLDVEFDNNMKLLIAEHGPEGLAVIIVLWQMIYANEGYYIEYNDDVKFLIKMLLGIEFKRTDEIIQSALKRKIFSIQLFEKYKIITSSGIQKRYFEASKRKKNVTVIPEYILIDLDHYKNISIPKKKENKKEKTVDKIPKKILNLAEEIFGHTLSPLHIETIKEWVNKHGADVVLVILQKVLEKKPDKPFPYMAKIFEARQEELKNKLEELDFDKIGKELIEDDIDIPF